MIEIVNGLPYERSPRVYPPAYVAGTYWRHSETGTVVRIEQVSPSLLIFDLASGCGISEFMETLCRPVDAEAMPVPWAEVGL